MAGSKPGGAQSKNLKPRVGRGAGYGGPAKGTDPNRKPRLGSPETAATQNPSGLPGPWAERKAEIAAKSIAFFEEVLDGPHHETLNRMTAADKLLDRVIGKPKQMVENSGETTMIIKTGVPRADRD